MTRGQTVLILGGGVGGLVAATKLRRKVSKRHRIILVDREARAFSMLSESLGIPTALRM